MKKNRLAVIAILVVTALLCAACGKTEEPASNPVPTKAETVQNDVTPEAKPTEPETTPEVTAEITPEAAQEDVPDVPDEDEEIIDESFTTDMFRGSWYSLIRDYGFEVLDDGSFILLCADADEEPVGHAYVDDYGQAVLDFYDTDTYGEAIFLHPVDYDRLISDSAEMFVIEGADTSMYNDTGVICLNWYSLDGSEAPELSVGLFDADGRTLAWEGNNLYEDGSREIVYNIPGYFVPDSFVISGDDPVNANLVMEGIDFTISMSKDLEDDIDYYGLSKVSLDECYVRSYTGVWCYSIPIDWIDFTIAGIQAD